MPFPGNYRNFYRAQNKSDRKAVRTSAAIRQRGDVPGPSRDDSFEAVVLPHLDAAYNLARWLMRDRAAAEDVVQDAMLRALTYFASFKGANPRAWLLQIVRNAAYASNRVDPGLRLVPLDDGGLGETL